VYLSLLTGGGEEVKKESSAFEGMDFSTTKEL
jgi:hypothetical protein